MQATDLRSYMAQTEQAIASAFTNDRLAIHLAGGVQGPHTLTFAVRLYQPTKSNVAKALSLAPAIEATTGISPIRVYPESGHILIEVPSPAPVTIHGRLLRGSGLAVPLGMTSRRGIAGVDFERNPHLLFVGPTGRGKTTAGRLLAYHLAKQNRPRHCRFIVSTFKPKDWRAFGTLAHCMAVITDPTETGTMIEWLTRLMYNRVRSEQDTPHLFVFLDDLLNLLSCVDVADQLGELASLGRGAGIHLIIGTQRVNEKGGGSSTVVGNIPSRLIFGTASAQDSAAFSGRGESGAERLGRYPGDALLVDDGRTQRLAVALVTDADLGTLPQHDDDWRPWQQNLQRYAGGGTTADRTSIVPATRTADFTPENGQNDGRYVPPDQGVESGISADGIPFAPRYVPQPTRLPDAPPNADEQKYLRQLYLQLGSKRAVLKAAWGGVVNEEGRTPKTIKWLDEALGE